MKRFLFIISFSLLTTCYSVSQITCNDFQNYLDTTYLQAEITPFCSQDKGYVMRISHNGYDSLPFSGIDSIQISGSKNYNCFSTYINNWSDSSIFWGNHIYFNDRFTWDDDLVSGYRTLDMSIQQASINGETCSINKSFEGYLQLDFNGLLIDQLDNIDHCQGQYSELILDKVYNSYLHVQPKINYQVSCYGNNSYEENKPSFNKVKRINDSTFHILYPGDYTASNMAQCYASWAKREFEVKDNSCGTIEGVLAFDTDKDCSVPWDYDYGYQNPYKDHVAYRKVTLNPGGYTTITNSKGYYFISGIPFGTYSISIDDPAFTNCTTNTEVTLDSNNQTLDHIVYIYLDDQHNVISGNLSFDNNKTCTYTRPLGGNKVIIDNGDLIIYTDDYGNFSTYLPNGRHTFSFGEMDTITNYCGDLEFPLDTLLDETNPFISINAMAQSGEYHETSVVVSDPRLRPGFKSEYRIVCKNTGTFTSEDVQLKVVLDDRLIFDGIYTYDEPYDSISGDTLIWNFNLNDEEWFRINISLPADVELLGDSIIVKAFLTANSSDEAILENNFNISNVVVVGSYDPNDVTLTNLGRTNTSSILLEDEWLNYRIRFQNTGTFMAERVVVTDKLPPEVDVDNLIIDGASHDYILEIKNGNILEFSFNDIRLSAEQDNEARSHGWIKYRVKQSTSNQIGDIVKNRAEIYFDYNPAIVTNRTHNPIEYDLTYHVGIMDNQIEDKIVIYPNPTQGLVNIKNTNKTFEQAMLYDMNGRIIFITPIDNQQLNLDQLDVGIYLLKLVDSEGNILVQKVSKQ